MDYFHLKQWREEQQQQSDQQQTPSAKLQRLLLDNNNRHNPPSASSSPSSAALPLFATTESDHLQPTTNKLTNLSAFPSHDSTSTTPRMGNCYFSLRQWQELELQALIFRHMLAGAAVPSQLLHLLKKTALLTSSGAHPHPAQYYLSHPHYHPAALLQSGYWGKGAMDPEPGRCRRTDGKKWRCSRDVTAGHKYCERHLNRGRSRSRKPVEIPTPPSAATGANGGGGGVFKTNINPIAAMAGGGGENTHFALPGSSPSFDLLHFNQRSSNSMYENKGPFGTQNNLSEDGKPDGQILRPFFDDWPRSAVNDSDNTGRNASSVTDFSLKLSTGNGGEGGTEGGNLERERAPMSWGTAWGTNQVAPLGGPLAEALRSSISNSYPTSVLHQLQRGSTSEVTAIPATEGCI